MDIVIKIPEEMVYRFKNKGEQKYYDYHTVLTACINGTPLNEVLDKIANEFEQNRLETIKLMNTPCQTKTMQEFKQQERYKADCDIICRTLQCAIDIVNKYKESEDK